MFYTPMNKLNIMYLGVLLLGGIDICLASLQIRKRMESKRMDTVHYSTEYTHRRLVEQQAASYTLMFYFLVGAMMLTCLVYNIFFKHKMETTFLRQYAPPETMLRQDVLASDLEIDRLWECDVCNFKSYDAQQTCMLCGTERSFQFDEKRTCSQSDYSGNDSSCLTTSGSTTKYILYVEGQGTDNGQSHKDSTSTTLSTPKKTMIASNQLTPHKKMERFKRKLSGLNLRQQSARRRHEWIRQANDEGELIWVRRKNYLDRKQLKTLRTLQRTNSSMGTTGQLSTGSSCSSLRESMCSTGSSSSFGIVSRVIVSPRNPNGRLELDNPNSGSASARRCSENSSRFTREELDQVTALPFQQKQAWFVQHTAVMEVPWEYGHLLLEIDRENVLHNSCEQLLWANPEQLHQSLRIKFTNEPGVDAGGLVREWFTLMTQEVFDDRTGLFYTSSNGNALTINPASQEASVDHLMYYQAIGRFIGRALFEGILIDAHLSLPICKHILGIPITFSDLEFLDNDVYKNLNWLRKNTGVESLALDFTVCVDQMDEKAKVVELIPNGAQIPVTDENKLEYIRLRFEWIVATSISQQLASLVHGLHAIIPEELLSVFDHQELELLICGIPEINMQDWQQHTVYVGERDQKVTQWFWNIVEQFTNEQKARLLQFTTGSARVPVQGFKALTMNDGRICPFAIQVVRKEECLYPRAHTCFNRIDLPRYDTEKDLRIALSLVIRMEVTGFTIE